MKYKELIQKVRNSLHKLRRGYGGEVRDERDWAILLGVAGVGLLASIAINAVFFVRAYEGEPISQYVNTNPESRETQELTKELESVSEVFEAREARQEKFLTEPYGFVDPARN